MTNDTLQRMAAANPVPVPAGSAATPSAQAVLREILSDRVAEGLHAKTNVSGAIRRRAASFGLPTVAVVSAAVAAVVVILTAAPTRSPRLSLVADAYAATRAQGNILHYVVTSVEPARKPFRYLKDSAQVWVSGDTWHAYLTHTEVFDNRSSLTQHEEEEMHNGIYQVFYPRAGPHGLIHQGRAEASVIRQGDRIIERAGFICPGVNDEIALLTAGCLNPLAMLRTLYQSRELRSAGQAEIRGRPVAALVIPAAASVMPERIRILINTMTYAPLQLQIGVANYKSTTTFTDYERLPLTNRNRQLLQMSRHPKAHLIHQN